MRFIGAHLSILGGLESVVFRAYEIGATTFSCFLKNQRRWLSKKLTESDIYKFKKSCHIFGYSLTNIVPHASYLINLGHPDSLIRRKSQNSFIMEINRCYKLGINFLNFHPGSHLKKINETECLNNIIESINLALSVTKEVILLIENTSGQGSNIGYCFEHLSYIINNVFEKSRIGVCLDSCHLFSSGYEIRDFENFRNTFYIFNKIVGLKYLKCIHLNDSASDFNSRIDRHHNLGLGKIGKNFFIWLMMTEELKNISIILETKNKNFWKKEIQWLKYLDTFKKNKIF